MGVGTASCGEEHPRPVRVAVGNSAVLAGHPGCVFGECFTAGCATPSSVGAAEEVKPASVPHRTAIPGWLRRRPVVLFQLRLTAVAVRLDLF